MLKRGAFFLFIGDMAVFAGALVLALTIRNFALPSEQVLSAHFDAFFGIFFLWAFVFFVAGLYDTGIELSRKRIPDLVIKAQGVNLLIATLIFFIFPLGITPKLTLALYLTVSTVLIIAWRLFLFPAFARRSSVRALVVGSGEEAEAVVSILNRSRYFGFMSASHVDPRSYSDIADLEGVVLARIDMERIDIVVGDMRGTNTLPLTQLYYNLTFLRRAVRFMSLHQLYEQLFNCIPPSLVYEGWLLENVSQAPRRVYIFLKRCVDITVALVLLVLALPFYLLAVILILLDDGGPLFYVTERVGQYNQPIRLIKFRTMTGRDVGSEALQSAHTVTRVGAFLRTSRIDELPQLINILRGDLSFVGPRPEMPALAAVYAERIPYYNMRHLVKPGLSGWAQINDVDAPRQGVDVERTVSKLSLDLYYLKQHSIILDFEIILKTIRVLLSRNGT